MAALIVAVLALLTVSAAQDYQPPTATPNKDYQATPEDVVNHSCRLQHPTAPLRQLLCAAELAHALSPEALLRLAAQSEAAEPRLPEEERQLAALFAMLGTGLARHGDEDSAARMLELSVARSTEADGPSARLNLAAVRANRGNFSYILDLMRADADAARTPIAAQLPIMASWHASRAEAAELVQLINGAMRPAFQPDDGRDAASRYPARGSTDVVNLSILRHHAQQMRYLLRHGRDVPPRLARRLEEECLPAALQVMGEIARSGASDDIFIPVPEGAWPLLQPWFNRAVFVPPLPQVAPGTAVNPLIDWEAVQDRYFAQREIMFVDDLLSHEALDRLYRFALEATVFYEPKVGYFGAYLNEGLYGELLQQIADELRERMPRIFGDHPLNQLWAYKYDSSKLGIGVHADAATVNVNLWVTPDEANLDPSSGGLVVYRAPAPLHWEHSEYNTVGHGSRLEQAFLDAGIGRVVIPYRCNRITIFNSNLFHRTDDFTFREQYRYRRVNFTFLYGQRASSHANAVDGELKYGKDGAILVE